MAYRVLTGFDVKIKSDPTHFRRIEPGTVLADDDLDCSEHFGWMLDDGMIQVDEPEPEADPNLTKTELQDLARANDLPVSGNKDEILERLQEAGVEGV